MNIIALPRPARALSILLILAALAGGCARPTAQATPNPDAAALAGQWQQFIPIGGMPEAISLDPSGSSVVDGETGRWRLQGGMLVVRQGGGERSFSYTVSGYLMTLFDGGSDTSGFYINPAAFAEGAGGNGELRGQWAAFDSWGKLVFDGKAGLASIVHTEAGDTRIDQTYAARDGILQTVDTSGNYTYNLYSISQDGALLLAETSDYDNDVKQWTPYWKRAQPGAALLGRWTRVIRTNTGEGGLPEALRLDGGGTGSAGAAGASLAELSWEYYESGFVLLRLVQGQLYAWCNAEGGVLFLGNPDLDECWYVDDSRYQPTAEPLKELAGRWATEDGALSLEIAGDSFTLRGAEGEEARFTALAADGMLRLARDDGTWHAAYTLGDDGLRLYGAGLPVIGQVEMPVAFVPAEPR